jgi:pyruvate formate lyase activating enzyme
MEKATIFNIQKFCVHDGPGIRTSVFFKGCPLSCIWCHNPESQVFTPELLYNKEKCINCGNCASACPQDARSGKGHCKYCGTCTDVCTQEACVMAGREYDIKQLLAEIEKDLPFYEHSGGGITLSGGEALCQINFVEELTKSCCKKGIGIVVDTCGQVPYESFERILSYTDLFLYDLKFGDPARHKRYTGRDNLLILDNLRKLASTEAKISLRVPLIEGINADDANVEAIISLIEGIELVRVNLLPYHEIGWDKYKRLNRQYPRQVMASPSVQRLDEIQCRFEASGFETKIGG